jgi:hypothetical protein
VQSVPCSGRCHGATSGSSDGCGPLVPKGAPDVVVALEAVIPAAAPAAGAEAGGEADEGPEAVEGPKAAPEPDAMLAAAAGYSDAATTELSEVLPDGTATDEGCCVADDDSVG